MHDFPDLKPASSLIELFDGRCYPVQYHSFVEFVRVT